MEAQFMSMEHLSTIPITLGVVQPAIVLLRGGFTSLFVSPGYCDSP